MSTLASSKAETSITGLSPIPQQTSVFPGLATRIITESLLSPTPSHASFCATWALRGLSDFVLQYPRSPSIHLLHSLSVFSTFCIHSFSCEFIVKILPYPEAILPKIPRLSAEQNSLKTLSFIPHLPIPTKMLGQGKQLLMLCRCLFTTRCKSVEG